MSGTFAHPAKSMLEEKMTKQADWADVAAVEALIGGQGATDAMSKLSQEDHRCLLRDVAQALREAEARGRENRGPCLIAKPGRNVSSCHENDFCQCDIDAAEVRGMEKAAKIAERSCLVEPDGGSPTKIEIDCAKRAADNIRSHASKESPRG